VAVAAETGTEYCLLHALEVAAAGRGADLTLRVRVPQDELSRVADDVRRRADRPRDWVRRLRAALAQARRPPLRAMQLLLQEADKLPVAIPEAAVLRVAVEAGAACADRIARVLARSKRKRAPARNERDPATTTNNNNSTPATGTTTTVAASSTVGAAGPTGEGKARLADVEALLEEAAAVPFDLPEVAELRVVVRGVAAFQERARRLLALAAEAAAAEARQTARDTAAATTAVPGPAVVAAAAAAAAAAATAAAAAAAAAGDGGSAGAVQDGVPSEGAAATAAAAAMDADDEDDVPMPAIEELSEALAQGRSLEVDVDEVSQLHTLTQQLAWRDKGASLAVHIVPNALHFVPIAVAEMVFAIVPLFAAFFVVVMGGDGWLRTADGACGCSGAFCE
jgi:hypothetical protein